MPLTYMPSIPQVIHIELLRFHELLERASSLDEMIAVHDLQCVMRQSSSPVLSYPDHISSLSRLQTLCFLSPNVCYAISYRVHRYMVLMSYVPVQTTSVRKAILSVLDLCLHFTDVYRAYSGGAGTVDVSRRAIRFTNNQRSRRRRLNRQQQLRRKNLIGFTSDALPASSDEEEEAEVLESSPEDDEGTSAHAHAAVSMDDVTLQTTMSISFADIDFSERIDKIGSELDALVRYLSKHTEGLASSGAEEAGTFAGLAFALDDWDL